MQKVQSESIEESM